VRIKGHLEPIIGEILDTINEVRYTTLSNDLQI
jgi:hypothetical protein